MTPLFLSRYLKRRLFIKIFLIYSIIIVLSLLGLSIFITSNITQTLKSKELDTNMQILGNISSYFDQKYSSSLSMIQQIYANIDAASDLSFFLKNDFGDYLENRLDIYSSSSSSTLASYQSYFNAFFIRDHDIGSMVLYSTGKDFFYAFGDSSGPRLIDFSPLFKRMVNTISDDRSHYYPYLFVSTEISKGDSYMFSTLNSINDPESLTRIGSLIVNYKLEGIRSLYQKYSQDIKGYILILTKDGDVIFDSSDRYYGVKYPYMSQLTNALTPQMLEEKSYVHTKETLSGALIAAIIPEGQIRASTKAIRRTIGGIALTLIFVSLMLTYFTMQIFSRRTQVIMQGLEALKKGDLTVRIPVSKSEDELTQIAVNFNHMCDSLNEYINKVYLSEIKQKNAQMMALQSQINPHFLYNTLEVVRMKAVSVGASTVGNMVYILATLFRNAIKGETFIAISTELEHCSLYLELFRIRYEDRLTFTIDVATEIMEYTIVKFTLQPVIENYILHGIRQDSENNKISISAFLSDHVIHFIIKDNGIGIEEDHLAQLKKMLADNIPNPTTAIGLQNVNERLRIIYGNQYGLDITSRPDRGTTIEIKIPAHKKEASV